MKLKHYSIFVSMVTLGYFFVMVNCCLARKRPSKDKTKDMIVLLILALCLYSLILMMIDDGIIELSWKVAFLPLLVLVFIVFIFGSFFLYL